MSSNNWKTDLKVFGIIFAIVTFIFLLYTDYPGVNESKGYVLAVMAILFIIVAIYLYFTRHRDLPGE